MNTRTNKREASFKDREKRQLAIATKFVPDKRSDAGFNSEGNKNAPTPPTSMLSNISQRTASVQNDIESIRQLLPDVELTTQILISSVLSPKDLGQPKLTFGCSSDLNNDELVGKMLSVVEEYFVDDYKINDKLPEILNEALVSRGAYVEAIIPESSLDKVINPEGRVSLESVRSELNDDFTIKPLGVLNLKQIDGDKPAAMTLESMFDVRTFTRTTSESIITGVGLTDNPDALKVPTLLARIRQESAAAAYASHFSLESISAGRRAKVDEAEVSSKAGGKSSSTEMKEKVDHFKDKTHREIVDIIGDQQNTRPLAHNGMISFDEVGLEESIGHALVMKLPMESVIPTFMPGRPEDHEGYFVILDQFGNAIDLTNQSDHYKQLQSNLGQKTAGETAVSNVISELKSNGFGSSSSAGQDAEEAVTVFSQIMEKRLLSSLSTGGVEGGLKLSQSNNVYSMMLSRALANQNTQVLYLPKEMVSYIAFNYTVSGIGKSLLEDTRILGSLRILMMFSNTMGAIRNSTSRTELNITLDPTDTDPLSTVTMVKEAYMRSRAEGYPLGEGDPSAMVRYLQQAGVDVVYGNHPDLPDMSVATEDKSTSKAGIDTELADNLRDWHIMGFGMSPETVDSGKDVDFATSIVASNLLLSKRVIILQQKFQFKLEHKVRTMIRYSETLMSKLRAIVQKSHGRKKLDVAVVIDKFIRKLTVSLPKPDAATLKAKMESLEDYSSALDTALEHIVNDEFAMTDAEGDVSDKLDEVRSAIKAYYMRRYMKENSILPELEEITDVDEDGKPVFNFDEIQGSHMKSVLGGIDKYLRRAKKAAKKREIAMEKYEEQLEKMGEEEPEEEEPENTEDSVSDDEGGDEEPEETGEDPVDDSGEEEPEPETDDAEDPDTDGVEDEPTEDSEPEEEPKPEV